MVCHLEALKESRLLNIYIFNTYNNSFEIRPISNYIDRSLSPITIPPTLLIDWESSYLKCISTVPSSSVNSLNTNSDTPPNKPSGKANTTYFPGKSTRYIDLNAFTSKVS